MVENNDEIIVAFNKMMKESGMLAKISPIFKKDIKNFDGIVKVNWKICRKYLGYQIFEEDNYTFKIGEHLENPDILVIINDRDLAIRFMNGESLGFSYSPRRDYKGRFRIMYVVGFKDVINEKGEKKKQRITKHFLTAHAYNNKVTHPFNLLKLPPFQRGVKRSAKAEEYGAYIPINKSLGTYENKVIPYKVFEHFINKASNIVMINCGCRVFNDCQDHDHSLGCIYMGDDTLELLLPDMRDGFVATKEQALDRVRKAIDEGLIPLLGRAMGEAAIFGVKDKGHFLSSCFCCTCCCINGKFLSYGPSVNNTMFQRMDGVLIEVDEDKCIGCGKCVEVCVFGGRELVNGKAKLDLNRCLGCGRCAEVCPTGATTIEIDDVSRVEDVIGHIEAVVDVTPQTASEE